jgi:hypothetical protein
VQAYTNHRRADEDRGSRVTGLPPSLPFIAEFNMKGARGGGRRKLLLLPPQAFRDRAGGGGPRRGLLGRRRSVKA